MRSIGQNQEGILGSKPTPYSVAACDKKRPQPVMKLLHSLNSSNIKLLQANESQQGSNMPNTRGRTLAE